MAVLEAVVVRRILVNYRVDPEVAGRLVPLPLTPLVRAGAALGGVSLVRLEKMRPRPLAAVGGAMVESLSHRIAVTAPGDDGTRIAGILVLRRDTESRLVALASSLGGGRHRVARFVVEEDERRLHATVHTDDGAGDVEVDVRWGLAFEPTASFASLADAEGFFAECERGFTEGIHPVSPLLRFRAIPWQAEAVRVERARSAFFENEATFPKGTALLDGAVAMCTTPHAWVAVKDLAELGGLPAFPQPA